MVSKKMLFFGLLVWPANATNVRYWDECTGLCKYGQQKILRRCLGGVPSEADRCLGGGCDYKPFAILSKTRSARYTCDLPDNTEVAPCDLFHGVTGDHVVSQVFKNVSKDGLVTTKQLLPIDHVMPVVALILIEPHGMAVQQLALAVSSSEEELIHVL